MDEFPVPMFGLDPDDYSDEELGFEIEGWRLSTLQGVLLASVFGLVVWVGLAVLVCIVMGG